MNIQEHLRDKINNIPALPGIYKMMDGEGRIIYIGKSISLKNRVRSYFTGKHDWTKIERMVSLIQDIEYIVTDTHLEARLLECQLIKEIKPIFNSQFKNDEKYIYLKVEDYNPYNPLSLVYNREANSFGPFRRKSLLISLMNSLKNLYPILKEGESYKFEYNLMPQNLDRDIYEKNKQSLLNILSNEREMNLFLNELEKKMYEVATRLEFSAASYYRDLINALNYINKRINEYMDLLSKDIVLKIPISQGYKLFYILKGELILKASFTNLMENDMENFIHMGRSYKSMSTHKISEKSSLDYKDIIYSEIKSLPREMVIYV